MSNNLDPNVVLVATRLVVSSNDLARKKLYSCLSGVVKPVALRHYIGLYNATLTLGHKVPGEMKRSRDLEEGGGAGPSS